MLARIASVPARPFVRVAAALIAAAAAGCAVLTAIFAVDPRRLVSDTFVAPHAMAVALVWTVLYALLLLRAGRLPGLAIGAAIAARAAAFLLLGALPYPGTADPWANVVIAGNIMSGNGMVLTGLPAFLPAEFRALYPPVYPLMLAGAEAVLGRGPAAVFTLNSLVDMAAAITIAKIGHDLLDRRAGLVAGALYLLWPTAILLSLTAQKETTAVLLAAQCTLALVRLRERMRGAEALRLGIAAALLALTQPAWLPYPAILGALLLPALGASRAAAIAARAVPAFIAVMAPWWIRNWIVFGAFVPLTTAFGMNLLYVATNRFDALGGYYGQAGASELEGARIGLAWAIDIIRADPLRYLHTRFIDVAYAWGLNTFPGELFRDSAIAPRTRMIVYHVAQMSWLALLPVAAWALLRVAPRRPMLALLVWACFAQFALFQSWFEYSQRHRYLIVPALMLAIGAATRDRPRPPPFPASPGCA